MTALNMADDREKYEPYRIVTDYEGLHEAFRDRVEDLDVSRAEIEAAGGLQSGYAAKLLSAHPKRRFGQNSLGSLLKATGTALVMVVDDEKFAPIKASMQRRKRTLPAAAASIDRNVQETPILPEQIIKDHMRNIGAKGNMAGAASKGGKRRAKTMKKWARQQQASHAARKRWEKHAARS